MGTLPSEIFFTDEKAMICRYSLNELFLKLYFLPSLGTLGLQHCPIFPKLHIAVLNLAPLALLTGPTCHVLALLGIEVEV